MNADVVKVLREARDLLVMKGWKQHPDWRDADELCAGLAIRDVSKSDHDARRGALLHLRKVIGVPFVTSWNDAPGRTKEQVLEAFDRAIALASQEPRP